MLPRTDKQRISMARKIIRATNADPELAVMFQKPLEVLTTTFNQFKTLITKREQLASDMSVLRQKRNRAFRKVQSLMRRGWAEVRHNVSLEAFQGQLHHFHYTDSGFLPENEPHDSWVQMAEKLLTGMVANNANGYKPLDIDAVELETQNSLLNDLLSKLEILETESMAVTVQLDGFRSALNEEFRSYETLLRKRFYTKRRKVFLRDMRKFGFTINRAANDAEDEAEPDMGDGQPPIDDTGEEPPPDPDEEDPGDDPPDNEPPDDGTGNPPANPDPPTPSNGDDQGNNPSVVG